MNRKDSKTTVKYKSRPSDTLSSKVWDLFITKYGGTPTYMNLHACCGRLEWIANINGHLYIINSKELKGIRFK